MKASKFLTNISDALATINTARTAYKTLDAQRPRWKDCFLKDDGTVFVAIDELPIADIQALIDWLKLLQV